jgi:hypothetical protein
VVNHDLYYDQYLTPAEFLSDVQIIVNNASLDRDPEQVARAGMMLNYATVMIDQACDHQFRSECDRMAARERERIRQRKGKRREEAAAAAAARALAAEQPAEPVSAVTPAAAFDPLAASTSKRPREGEPGEDEDAPNKRQRSDEESRVNGLSTPEPSSAKTVAFDLPPSEPARSPLLNGTTLAPLVAPVTSLPPALAISPQLEPQADEMEVDKPPEPIPDPLPDLDIPEPELQSLVHQLEIRTSSFTVDQLEQLRAILSEIIWQHRSEWDRSAMVEECREQLANFVMEVEAWQASQALEA